MPDSLAGLAHAETVRCTRHSDFTRLQALGTRSAPPEFLQTFDEVVTKGEAARD
jgi:hypothetical protein